MARSRKPEEAAAATKQDDGGIEGESVAPVGGGDSDPDLENRPVDGSGPSFTPPAQQQVGSLFANGVPFSPFADVAAAIGMTPGVGQQAAPAAGPGGVPVHQPGLQQPRGEQQLTREGLKQYNNDLRVNVQVWLQNETTGQLDEVTELKNVLFSRVRMISGWIEHGGTWHVEFRNVKDGHLVADGSKTVTLRGSPPPPNYRPRLKPETEIDMDEAQTVALLARLGIVGSPQGQQVFGQAVRPVENAYGQGAGYLQDQIRDLKDQIGRKEAELKEAHQKVENSLKAEADAKQAAMEARLTGSAKDSEIKRLERDLQKAEQKAAELDRALGEVDRPQPKDPMDTAIRLVEVMKPNAPPVDPDKLTQKDILKMMMDSRDPDKMYQSIGAAMGLVRNIQETAGIKPGGAAGSGELDINKVASAAEKGFAFLEKRQAAQEQRQRAMDEARRQRGEGGGGGQQQTQQQTPAATEAAPEQQDKAALERTLDKILALMINKTDPVLVGRKMAVSVAWAGDLDFAKSDKDIMEYLKGLMQDPEKWIPLWAARSGIEEPYALAVAAAFRKAMNLPGKPADAAAQASEAPVPPEKKNGNAAKPAAPPPDEPEEESAAGETVADPKDALVGKASEGDGGAHDGSGDDGGAAAEGEQGGDDADVPVESLQNGGGPAAKS